MSIYFDHSNVNCIECKYELYEKYLEFRICHYTTPTIYKLITIFVDCPKCNRKHKHSIIVNADQTTTEEVSERVYKCFKCGSENLGFSEKYNARFCLDCLYWVEDNCGLEDCEFCKNRPWLKANMDDL